jgi:hypothetical protein
LTDTLTVYLSGDAYQGDAEATISVNGTPVGGTLDVSAVNAADDTEAFTFTGNFGANPQVAVSFINDAYGGSPSLDRNLYLDGFVYDGASQLNLKQELGYNQTDTYTLSATPPATLRAADFIAAIGVNTHLEYYDTAYALPNGSAPDAQKIASELAYLGISRIRDGFPTAQTLPAMQTLAADGIRFDMLVPSSSSPSQLGGQIASLDPLGSAVAAVEGPNEINIQSSFAWNGQTGDAAAIAYQQALASAVKSDAALAGAQLYNFTLASSNAADYTALGNLSADATYGNVHIYFANGAPPASTIRWVLGMAAPVTPAKPEVITETNYTSDPAIAGQPDATVQAKYDLDLLMDAARDGVAATYLYELLDEKPDPSNGNIEDHFGLFNNDGTPKPAATALHNLTTILGDTGSTAHSFQTGTLNDAVSGLPASGDTLLLEKSNGAYDIVLWAEPALWNASTQSEIAAAAHQVQVTLPTAAAVQVFDPLAGTSAIAQYGATSSVSVSLTDHPIVIEVAPGTTSPPPPPTPDTLALNISEDAWKGDARFTVKVDGAQVGGTYTASALHASGDSNLFLLTGDWGAGPHDVQVSFLNDAYGGTPSTDRNLYVDSIAYDGTTDAGTAAALYTTSSRDFSVGGAATAATAPADTLSVKLAEDAWKGDARFVLYLDGKAITTPQAVTASHAAGQWQEVSLTGTFGPGSHTLGVRFTNDAYGGTPQTDRNLYVGGISLNGQAIANGTASLYTTSTTNFTLHASA